jgi:hypothetical protein
MSLTLFAAMALGQLRDLPDPIVATKLRPGEIVRYFKRGGRTRFGQYVVLVAVTSRRAYIKTYDYSNTLTLNDSQRDRLRTQIVAKDMKSLFAKKRDKDYPPSALDGTDVFLATAQTKWDNTRYEMPTELPALIQMLDEWVESARPKPPTGS